MMKDLWRVAFRGFGWRLGAIAAIALVAWLKSAFF